FGQQRRHTPNPYSRFVMYNYMALSPLSCTTPPQNPLLRRFDYANVFTLIATLALTTIGY
ncbi:hypothetical protein ACE1BS_02970, partial [Aeromonas jandaei]